MCELFGVSTSGKVSVSDYLKEFFSHSKKHNNGWGIALFYGNNVSLEKEPLKAYKSLYLKERLKNLDDVYDMIAHIRLATRGDDEYVNTHPFVKRDNFGRLWTFAHNGTIFNYSVLDDYFKKQEGKTDSERIILYFIDKINERQSKLKRALKANERFAILDEIVTDMSRGNKINFLLYDGEILYVHCNYANTLNYLKKDKSVIFSTVPLSGEEWQLVPFTTLLAYKKGRLIKTGTNHGNEYKDNESDARLLYMDYSCL
jgi:glutamine amidotransferase